MRSLRQLVKCSVVELAPAVEVAMVQAENDQN